MRILPSVTPTPEQLTILADNTPGFLLIKGAAGSGKTTTALLRLRQLCASWLSRRDRLGLVDPVRVLVLTYNRTLEGYIAELARQQVPGSEGLQLQVLTFGKWALDVIGNVDILDRDKSSAMLLPLLKDLPGDRAFLLEEVEYLLGRYPVDRLDEYLIKPRTGRGISPRVESPLKRRLLADVVEPFATLKAERGAMDWNDIAIAAGAADGISPWDVVIVDEAQDFTANQVRALLPHLAPSHSVTFVMDAAQRIYPRHFTWKEVGVNWSKIYTLKHNYRNTEQIAAFARTLVTGVPLEDDGELPDFTACDKAGPLPTVVAGSFSAQVDYILGTLARNVDLANESVAFLHPRGGEWFSYLKKRLREAGLPFVTLTRASTWPEGTEQIALCTLHSAKGLEFDHVIIPGLNQQVTPHGDEQGDGQLDALRRLIAMGVGRAKKSVHIGFKPTDPSTILRLLQPGTYQLVRP